MIKKAARFFVVLSCVFGLKAALAEEIHPFYLERLDGTALEGYFSPPSTPSSPIIFAIQGSCCESALNWHVDLCNRMSSLGVGLVVLEKQGISKNGIDLLEYNKTNSLQNRLNDYLLSIRSMDLICPEWEGKLVFWGESEGGILAANLANQTPETAAVLLFASGGGMRTREEIKWALRHRLEEHEAPADEIDQYMCFLDEQMDSMILDPTPSKQFLGNTYKWWHSLIEADKIALSLNQNSFPIYFAHGVQDNKVPVLSADLAVAVLKETNDVTYLRLEGYGHDLDRAEVHAAACKWLSSVLLGQEQHDINLFTTMALSSTSHFADWKTAISDYVFSRGKGEVSISGGASRDTDGNQQASGGIGVSKETDSGARFEGRAEGSVRRDNEGHTRGEVRVEGSASWGF